jgi:hypothetical protein
LLEEVVTGKKVVVEKAEVGPEKEDNETVTLSEVETNETELSVDKVDITKLNSKLGKRREAEERGVRMKDCICNTKEATIEEIEEDCGGVSFPSDSWRFVFAAS